MEPISRMISKDKCMKEKAQKNPSNPRNLEKWDKALNFSLIIRAMHCVFLTGVPKYMLVFNLQAVIVTTILLYR